MIFDKGLLGQSTDIDIEDLLFREPVEFDDSKVKGLIKDKVCMVSGGGGSIGSELCRQIMKYEPELLVVVDIYENNAYDIQQELLSNY
ncbi:MAG: polysaccharide biosynthesis protein, partial [Bacillota bacterium]|nr:polysaccharide biosynthesis protein [Bacillota bacterium]